MDIIGEDLPRCSTLHPVHAAMFASGVVSPALRIEVLRCKEIFHETLQQPSGPGCLLRPQYLASEVFSQLGWIAGNPRGGEDEVTGCTIL